MNRAHPQAVSSDSLQGTPVRNHKGENLGNIEELMIDLNTGRVAYAVLSFGGLLGIGDKLFAVPWECLTVDTERETFVMDIDRQRLMNAPGFDKNDWPEAPGQKWYHDMYDYYDQRPYWS
jgi:sporulation protein YlmC with PRC-barrel domain